MEAEVDEDDGTFTNISLADDSGKASRDYSATALLFFSKLAPFCPSFCIVNKTNSSAVPQLQY